MRKSRVVDWMDQVGEAWLRWLRESLLLQGMAKMGEKLENAFLHSRTQAVLSSVVDVGERSGGEAGLLATLGRGLLRRILRATSDTVGGALILYGSVGVLVTLLSEAGGASFAVSCGAILLGVPLLVGRCSLGRCIGESLCPGSFLLGFCGLLREELVLDGSGERHYGGAILFGVGAGLSVRLFPWLIPATVLLLLLCALFARLPELILLGVGVGIPFLDLTGHATVGLAVAVLLLLLFWWKKLARRRRFFCVGICDPPVLLLAALYVASGALGRGMDSFLCGLARGGLILSFFPAVSLLSRPLWRRRFLDALQIGGGACSLVGILQYFFTDLELRWVDRRIFGDLGGRVCALFSNPNVLAAYLLLLIPLALAVFLERESRGRRRLLHGIALAAEVLCLVLTWCRGAWLGILGAGVFFLLLARRRSAGAFFLGALPILALSSYLPHQVRRRFLSIGGVQDSSIRYRYSLWEGVDRMRAAHPWGIGVGEATFRSVYPDFAVSGTETVMHAHRLFEQVGVELGQIGVCVLAVFLIFLSAELARGVKNGSERSRGQCLALFASVLGCLIMGQFDYVWYHHGVFLLFWLLSACLCAAAREGDQGDGEKG